MTAQQTTNILKETNTNNRQGLSKSSGGRAHLSALDVLHALLVLVSCLSIAYVIFDFWQNSHQGNKILERNLLFSSDEPVKLPELSTRPLSYYEENVAVRDLFSLTQGSSPSAGTSNVAITSDANVEALRNLQLQGTLLGQTSEAIIRDSSNPRSLFVHEGEELKGAVVKRIEEGKVTLEYQGQVIELIRK